MYESAGDGQLDMSDVRLSIVAVDFAKTVISSRVGHRKQPGGGAVPWLYQYETQRVTQASDGTVLQQCYCSSILWQYMLVVCAVKQLVSILSDKQFIVSS